MRRYTLHSWTPLTVFQAILIFQSKNSKNCVYLSIHLTFVLIFSVSRVLFNQIWEEEATHLPPIQDTMTEEGIFFHICTSFFPYLGEVTWIWVDDSCDLHWIGLCRKAKMVICTVVGDNTQLWTATVAVQTLWQYFWRLPRRQDTSLLKFFS